MINKKTRQDFFLALARIREQNMTREELTSFIEDRECDNGDFLNDLAMALQQDYSGVTNGFLSDVFDLLFNEEETEFEGEVEELYACPCCGYKTLYEIYDTKLGTGYGICYVCRWEDDGTHDVNQPRSINRGSILDYRRKMSESPNFYYRERYYKEDNE